MRASMLAAVVSGAILTALSGRIGIASETVRLAQLDSSAHMGPQRSPRVVIEEPRPPRTVIETEGRGDNPGCPFPPPRVQQEDAKLTRPEPPCDR
jgi:hypothetical protein